MNNLFTLIGVFSLILFQSIVVYFYVRNFFVVRTSKQRFLGFVLLVFMFAQTSITINQMPYFSLRFLSLFITLFVIFYFLSGDFFKKLFHYLFLIFIFLFQEKMAMLVSQNLSGESLIILYVFQLLLICLACGLVLSLKQFRIANLVGLTKREYGLLAVTPTISIVLLTWDFGGLSVCKVVGLALSLLLINITILSLYNNLIGKNLKLTENQAIRGENQVIEEMIKQEKELSILRHDLKNIVSSIDFYADLHQDKEIKNITSEILGQHVLNRKITGCVPIDAILNQKITLMNQKNIAYHLDAQIPYDLDLSSKTVDICALLGNLLDNAIEEMERSQSTGEIRITLRFNKGKLGLKVTNPVKNNKLVLKLNGTISQKGTNRIGLGLQSISDRVLKLKGHIDVSVVSNDVIVLVAIPLTGSYCRA